MRHLDRLDQVPSLVVGEQLGAAVVDIQELDAREEGLASEVERHLAAVSSAGVGVGVDGQHLAKARPLVAVVRIEIIPACVENDNACRATFGRHRCNANVIVPQELLAMLVII